jgi:hypothetical protein
MFQILFVVFAISVIWYTITVRQKAKAAQAADLLSGGEKVFVWVASLANPIVAGAIFYYGWRTILPHKAKQSNMISMWAFLIELVLVVAYFMTLGATSHTLNGIFPTALNSGATQSSTTSSRNGTSASWHIFHSNLDSFNVAFPTDPTFIPQKSADIASYTGAPYTNDVYESASGHTVYYVNKVTYSSVTKTMTPASMAQALLVGMSRNGQSITSKPGTFGNDTSLDFSFMASGFSFKGKIIILSPTSYMTLMAQSNDLNVTDYNTFVSSFTLK